MTVFLGIDPGVNGAIALLNGDTHELVIHDMPIHANAKGRNVVDMSQLCTLIVPPDGEQVKAALEHVHAFRGQGIASAFNFGVGYGGILMALAGHGIPFRDAIPSQWKKHYKITRKKKTTLSQYKQQSISIACQLFPAQADLFSLKKHDGRAEAALIALYGKEVLWSQHQ